MFVWDKRNFLKCCAVSVTCWMLGCGGSGTSTTSTAAPGADAAAPAVAQDASSAKAPEAAPAPPAPPAPLVLREGTSLKVRTTTALSTKSHDAGQSFQASLAEDLMVDGELVAKRGTPVTGTVVESDPGGRAKGVAHIAVRLTRIQLNQGEAVDLQTNIHRQEARTTKRNDAVKVGVASGIGAAIGAIAGGGQGAAIGAAAGAGAGTGAVLVTHGDPAVIPSESVLTFRLASPVKVTRL